MMMTTMAPKCKKHPYEHGVGVCASCLRERLLDLLAAQSGRPPQHCCGSAVPPQLLQRQHSSSGAAQPLPPPLVFPRSVSPYVSRRRSVDLDLSGDGDPGCRRRGGPRFFSTPQVGPGAGRWKAARGRFLASLFGGGHHSRSEEVEPAFVDSGPPHRSSSWFSALLRGRRKKQEQQQQQKKKSSRYFEEEEAAAAAAEDGARRSARRRGGHYGGGGDDSTSESGYSTESSGGWRIPAPTPMRKHASSAAHRTMSGFVVCLSPLVRASPRPSQAGEGGGAAALPGELRGARPSSLPRPHHHHRHGSGGGGPPALVPNRSRKLGDLGRFR